jgi:hypothetical protein
MLISYYAKYFIKKEIVNFQSNMHNWHLIVFYFFICLFYFTAFRASNCILSFLFWFDFGFVLFICLLVLFCFILDFRALEDKRGEARCFLHLGIEFYDSGQTANSIDYIERSVKICKQSK